MAVEQLQKFTNNATTTVPGTTNNVTTTITVATGTGALFPTLAGSEFFIATLVNTVALDPGFGQMEIVKVTARSGDVMTVVRGQEGTSGTNFPSGVLFELRPTAQAFNNIYTEVLELETTKAPLASPVFTGNPTAPTPSVGDNDTSIATTAFVSANPSQGALIGIQVLTTSGNYTPTSGTNSIVWHMVGGGGGGGGTATTAAGQVSVGGGGGAGGYCSGRETSGFSGSAYTIGAAGAGGNGVAGSTGGNSTFMGATASGGTGGPRDGPAAAGFVNAVGALGGAATGANLVNTRGAPGGCGITITNDLTGVLSGGGADSPFGTGGRQINGGQAAGNAAGFGAGGGGEAVGPSAGATQTGGSGTAGVLVIYEYH